MGNCHCKNYQMGTWVTVMETRSGEDMVTVIVQSIQPGHGYLSLYNLSDEDMGICHCTICQMRTWVTVIVPSVR